MSRLVVVVPLRDGARKRAEELLEKGPPFDVTTTRLCRHEVFLTDSEVIFDFETPGAEPPLELRVEDPALHEVAEAWSEVMAGSPRKAMPAFAWAREPRHDD
jgi:hypothetical protein